MSGVALRLTRPGAWQRLLHECRQTFEGLAEGLGAARRYERLAAMSDHDLARLGISREDVPRVAIFGKPDAR